MVPNKVVRNIAEFLMALKEIYEEFDNSLLWCRGHADVDWKLVPSVHRKPEGLESELATHFRLRAPARYPNCPPFGEHAAWLPLMRHYGLATRLLDWSESPLIAMFFAIASFDNVGSSAVWAVSPGAMNNALTGSSMISTLGGLNPRVTPLVSHAFGIGDPQDTVVAVSAPQSDLRMAVQLSHYSIHGSRTPLEEHPNASQFLRKIVIPANSRDDVRRDLTILGIRRSSVFPDLHNLALELNEIGVAPDKSG